MSLNIRQRKAELAYRSRKIIDLGEGSYVIQGRPLRKGGRAPSHHIQPHPQKQILTCPREGVDELGYCKHTRAFDKFIAVGKNKVGLSTPASPGTAQGAHDRLMRGTVICALMHSPRGLRNGR